jgi:hypothetical protein
MVNDYAKRTCKLDFWRNRWVNHYDFLICTQAKS